MGFMMKNYSYKDVKISWQNSTLTLSNSRLTRCIDWSRGMPKTLSMSVDQVVLAGENPGFDFHIAGFSHPGIEFLHSDYQLEYVNFSQLSAPDGDGCQVTVHVYEAIRGIRLQTTYIMYPMLPVLAIEHQVTSPVIPMQYWHPRQRGESFHSYDASQGREIICDSLQLNGFKVTQAIETQMRTDYYDEPVLAHDYIPGQDLYGNILLAENPAGQKFFYLQEAPPSMERRGDEPGDFLVGENQLVASLGSGLTMDDITPDRQLRTNRVVMGMAADGDVQTLIKRYLQYRRPAVLPICGTITVNPWGCGCFPQLLNAEFMNKEIEAAGKIAADVYQIDDGYEHGLLQDLTLHNRSLDKTFWSTRRDLLPEDFAPLRQLAGQNNLQLSLWFAPSFNVQYRNWRESADILLQHFRKNRFSSFKLDAVVLNSYTAEENFHKLLSALYQESDGQITVNLDVTNGTRGGLYKFAEYGLIFLENRYCCHQWVRNPYHPENTLDNLWNIAQYAPIQSLQIEIPNPGNCNAECYKNKNMPLPTLYSLEYWAMIPFFASPLLWMAPSQLSEENIAILNKLMQLQRKYRDNWRNAIISPVGNRPDGAQITGFYADSGYLLLFRELQGPSQAQLQLPKFTQAELLYSTHSAGIESDGTVSMAQPGSAALFKLK